MSLVPHPSLGPGIQRKGSALASEYETTRHIHIFKAAASGLLEVHLPSE